MSKEQMRSNLLERYLSTGKVGLTKPKDDLEALDLIETILELYDDTPVCMNLSEISNKLNEILDI